MKSFEKFAHTYGKYNVIQKKIIKRYINFLENRIVDLGCGSEGLCKYREFEFYLGIDSSPSMLKLNPCNTLKLDFNTKECFEKIKKYSFSQIVSFSALQWARDLNFVFNEIKKLEKKYLLAIFTSNTFKALHNFLQISSPIYSKEEILKASEILNPKVEILRYEMSFSSSKELLEYIKFSGVRGEVRASRSKIKEFLKTFPVNSLEFEVLVLKK
ncbi:methyltransferase domain-containing protein [Caminibacter sp.]